MDDQHQSFEQHKQLDDNGAEYWSARSLSRLLEYSEFRHFQAVLARAKDACTTSGYEVEDHFEDSLVLVSIGSGAQRKLHDHMGSTELAANLFRATQAEEKMRRDEVQGKHHAN